MVLLSIKSKLLKIKNNIILITLIIVRIRKHLNLIKLLTNVHKEKKMNKINN